MTTFQNEKSFQDNFYKNLSITKDIAYGKGKEWRLFIPQYLSRNKFVLQGARVAEVGCGTGYFGASLIRDHNVDHIDFFDIAPSLSEKIKELFKKTDTPQRYNYICSDIIDLENKVANYDFVFAMGAIHHAYNLKRYFESICAVLKPGGFLIANEPSYAETASYKELIKTYEDRLNFKTSESSSQNYPRHDFFFRLSEYCCVARLAGFEVFLIEPWGREKGLQLSTIHRFKAKTNQLKTRIKNLFSKHDDHAQQSALTPSENLLIFQKPLTTSMWHPHLDILGCQ